MTYPQGWPPPQTGHVFQEGAALGQLIAQSDRQLYVLELVHDQLEGLPDRLAEKLKREDTGVSIKLRDVPGILLGLGAIAAAVSGKLSLTDAVGIIGKVSGGP